MQIETNRLIIRDICRSDWESIHTYTSLPEVTRHTAWGPNTKAYIEQVLASQQEQSRQDYELAICLKNDGILIGGIGIHVKDTNAELGYVLNPDYQGNVHHNLLHLHIHPWLESPLFVVQHKYMHKYVRVQGIQVIITKALSITYR
ncbi:N-acetyltransferase [Paenibacillus sp. 23TSA30-6]|nr:N-acetyltransferase [Paenibacillus sp. 23TSA30-6]